MIVTSTESGLELVTQPDHARLAAQVLALWRADGVPDHPRRDALLLAVREHDNGWQETDAAPRLDAGGRPLDFRDLPDPERFILWSRALDRLAATPYAAALVAQHSLLIHRDRPAESWRAFRLEMRQRRESAQEEAGLERDDLEADYRYLDLCDTISLVSCGAFDETSCRDHSIRCRDGAVEIDPFPLAGATTFEIPVRIIAERPYRDGPDLIAELAAARWTRRPIRLLPARP